MWNTGINFDFMFDLAFLKVLLAFLADGVGEQLVVF